MISQYFAINNMCPWDSGGRGWRILNMCQLSTALKLPYIIPLNICTKIEIWIQNIKNDQAYFTNYDSFDCEVRGTGKAVIYYISTLQRSNHQTVVAQFCSIMPLFLHQCNISKCSIDQTFTWGWQKKLAERRLRKSILKMHGIP